MIIKDVIIEYAPKAIGAEVSVNHVYISPLSGTFAATDVEIGNPEGWGDGFAVKAPNISASAKPMAIFSKLIKVDKVVVDSPLINYLESKGSSNIDALSRHGGEAEQKSWFMKDRKFVIKTLILKSPRVIWHTPLVDKAVVIDLPDIVMSNVGEGGGLSSSKVISLVMGKMVPPVSSAVKLKAKKLGHDVSRGARKLGDKIEGLFKK